MKTIHILIALFIVFLACNFLYSDELIDYKTISLHSDKINSVAISPDASFVATGGDDNLVKAWYFKSDKVLNMDEHSGKILKVIISNNNDKVISSSLDKTLKVWNLKDNSVTTLCELDSLSYSICISNDDKLLYCGCLDGNVYVIDLEKKIKTNLFTSNNQIWTISLSPDSKKLVTGGDSFNAQLLMWDLETKKSKEIGNHQSGITSSDFSSDGRYIVSSGIDNTARFWETEGNKSAKMDFHCGEVTHVQFAPNDQYVITSGTDNSIRLWDYRTGDFSLIQKPDNNAHAISISKDGEYLAVAHDIGKMKVYKVNIDGLILKSVADKISNTLYAQHIETAKDELPSFGSDTSSSPDIELIYSQMLGNKLKVKIMVKSSSTLKGVTLLIVTKKSKGINYKPSAENDKTFIIEEELTLDVGITNLLVVASSLSGVSVNSVKVTYEKGKMTFKKDTEPRKEKAKTVEKAEKPKKSTKASKPIKDVDKDKSDKTTKPEEDKTSVTGSTIDMYQSGRKLLDDGSLEEASKMLGKVISSDPQYFEAYIDLGYTLKRMKKINEALKVALKGIEVGSRSPYIQWGYYNVSCYYCLLNNKEQSIYYLKLAVEKDPNLKSAALADDDFSSLKDEKDFIKLVGEK